jgi:hypothetical protein
MTKKLLLQLLGAMCAAVLVIASMTGCQTTSSSSVSSLTSTNIVDTEPVPPGVPGTGPCGGYCSFIGYNNSGAGFYPACSPATITVRINGNIVPTTQYEVFWRYSALKKDCAITLTEAVKQHPVVTGKKYVYTLYFKPGFCPPAGTQVEIQVQCQTTGALLLNPTPKTPDATRN